MTVEQDAQPHVNPMIHVVAPVLALGATFVVRRMLNSGFRSLTGHTPPDAQERSTPLLQALAWTAVAAATAAVVEVAVYRVAASLLTED